MNLLLDWRSPYASPLAGRRTHRDAPDPYDLIRGGHKAVLARDRHLALARRDITPESAWPDASDDCWEIYLDRRARAPSAR